MENNENEIINETDNITATETVPTNKIENIDVTIEQQPVNQEIDITKIDNIHSEINELKEMLKSVAGGNKTEEVVPETEGTKSEEVVKEEVKEEEKKTESDNELYQRVEGYVNEIKELKDQISKLVKANEFASSGNANTQNRRGAYSYSDEDILKVRCKI